MVQIYLLDILNLYMNLKVINITNGNYSTWQEIQI
jgi:hypothetical protein